MKTKFKNPIALPNLSQELFPTERGEIVHINYDCCDESKTSSGLCTKYELYVQPDNNNAILFLLNTYDRQYLPDNIMNYVIDGIRPDVYDYVINVLNENKNVFVQWTTSAHTTSSYKIFYDYFEDNAYWYPFLNICDHLCFCGGKYTEIRNENVETIPALSHIPDEYIGVRGELKN